MISATASRQIPWDQHALRQPIYLSGRGAASNPIPSAEGSAASDEIAQAWGATKDTTSIAVLQAFAEQYSRTIYAEMALARIAELQKSQEQSAFNPADSLRFPRVLMRQPARARKACNTV